MKYLKYLIWAFSCMPISYVSARNNSHVLRDINTVKAYYDSSSFHIGGYVNVNTGKIESRHNYKRTDFISVEADDVVEISSPISLMAGIAFFDKNKRFISGAYQQKNGLLMEKAPHNAAFVIASRRIDYDYDPYLKIYATCNMHQSTEGKILEIERSLNSLEPTCFAIPVIFRPAIGRKDLESMGIDASKSNIRIPVHTVTNNGVILVVCDGNNNGGPSHKCLLAISSDNGLTWKHKILNISAGNNGILYDKKNGVVFIFGGRQFIKSYDDGKNWSSPVEMKISRVDGYDRIYGSPTTGIQLSNGILAMPYRALSVDKNKKVKESVNFVMYSKDGGNTWKQSPATNRGIMADEVTIAEYSPNQIMINTRGGTEYFWEATKNGRRVFVPINQCGKDINKYEIKGWKSEVVSDGKIWDPIVNAAFIKAEINGNSFGLFCNCYMPYEYHPRRNMLLQVSSDFKHWTPVRLLTPCGKEVNGYCSLCCINNNISFCYEDCEEGIMFADLTPILGEIITSLHSNIFLYGNKSKNNK